jgi:parvulin-like peptidyl-prolyl isomerase
MPAGAFVRTLGDPLVTDRAGRSATHGELARDYGEPFADAVFAAPVGRLVGPLASSFGLHLVVLRERGAESAPTVAEAREALTASWRHGRREEVRRQRLAELRQRYAVHVDRDLPAETHLSAAGEL